jgi:hypothetical protein
MKKLTLLKLVVVAAAAFYLYGQATTSVAETAPPASCPAFCFHLTCGGGQRAHCNSRGQCVCP